LFNRRLQALPPALRNSPTRYRPHPGERIIALKPLKADMSGLLKKSLALGDEAWVVTFVNEDVAD
jgi:hypothetical protein